MGVDIIFHRPQEGDFSSSDIRLGSRGDSFYEYLLCVFYALSQGLANGARQKAVYSNCVCWRFPWLFVAHCPSRTKQNESIAR